MNGKQAYEDVNLFQKKIISSVTIQNREAHYAFFKHAHDSAEIYFIRSGTCRMQIQDNVVECKPNDAIMILPLVVHSFSTDQEACAFDHIHVRTEGLLQYVLHDHRYMDGHLPYFDPFTTYIKADGDTRMQRLFQQLIQDVDDHSPYMLIYQNLHIMELITYIKEKGKQFEAISKKSFDKNKYEIISFTYNYIHRNYAEKILIEDIAKELNMSTRYLSKLFFEASNQTILNYMNTYRINQAIHRMSSTDEKLTDIAVAVGLSDAQHFSKLFHKMIGDTPSNYRKMIQEKDIDY